MLVAQTPTWLEQAGHVITGLLDIDVVMDLMVHELDIISSLVNQEVVRLEAVGIPILTPKIDLAKIAGLKPPYGAASAKAAARLLK